MDNDSVKYKDYFQMQQKIIFLKSELMKYQNEVKKHEESDYYSLAISLEQENAHLKSALKELSIEHNELKFELEKSKINEQEIQSLSEKQQLKQIEIIEATQKEKEELVLANKQLEESLHTIQNELSVMTQNKQTINDTKTMKAIEDLEHQFHDLNYQLTQQSRIIIETLDQKKLLDVEKLKQYLLQHINEKIDETNTLLMEILKLQKENELLLADYVPPSTLNSQAVSHLKVKLQKILSQSLDFEQQLDTKMRILQDLDQKIKDLSDEISG